MPLNLPHVPLIFGFPRQLDFENSLIFLGRPIQMKLITADISG